MASVFALPSFVSNISLIDAIWKDRGVGSLRLADTISGEDIVDLIWFGISDGLESVVREDVGAKVAAVETIPLLQLETVSLMLFDTEPLFKLPSSIDRCGNCGESAPVFDATECVALDVRDPVPNCGSS